MRLACLLLAPLVALVPAAGRAEAPPPDAAAAVARVEVEPDASVVREPLDKAKKAIERARGARDAGDVQHSHMIDDIARLWVKVAEQLIRATRFEAETKKVSDETRALEVQVERARALLTETQSRHGRAVAELEQLEGKAKVVGGGVLAPSPAPPAKAPGGGAP